MKMNTRQAMWNLLVVSISALTVSAGLTMSRTRDSISRPPYIQCQSSDECGKEYCCVIGMGRYSIPTCQPRGDIGGMCRPSGEPANTTLHYPDGALVELRGVYYQLCPCLGGLTCLEGEGEDDNTPQCGEDKHLNNNHLYDYGSQSFEESSS